MFKVDINTHILKVIISFLYRELHLIVERPNDTS